MKKKLCYLFYSVFVMFFFISIFYNQKAVHSLFAATEKVAVIGSSSFAAGCTSSYGFVKKLQNKVTSKNFICFAESGKSVSYFLDRYNTNVKGKGFSELIIYGGLNGLGSQSGLTTSQKQLETIFQSAKAEGIKIIVLGAQPFKGYSSWTQLWGDNIKSNNAWLATKPISIDVYIDTYQLVDKNNDDSIDPEFDSGDHLHLNKNGHELIFALLMQNVYGGYTPGPDAANFDTSLLNQQVGPSQKPVPTGYFPCSDIDPKTGSIVDAVIDTEEYTQETNLGIKCPTPAVKIPGLTFGGVYIPEQAEDVEGNFFAYLPFIGDYLLAVYRYAIAVAGILSIFIVLISGLQWMTSGGSADKISSAKKRIFGAIIGLILAILSYTVLYTINPTLVEFRNLRIQYIQGDSLTDITFYEEERGETDNTVYASGGKVFGSTDFDTLFQNFAACTGVNWQLYKAIAHHESGLNPLAKNPKSSATGLFQAMAGKNNEKCRKVLKKIGWDSYCDTYGLTNPEVNSAYATLIFNASVPTIKNKCPNASFDDKVFMLYYGHSSGPGALSSAIKNFSCSTSQWPDGLWPPGTTYEGKKIFNGASRSYVQKIVTKIRSYSINQFDGPKSSTQCPIGKKL